MLIDAFHFSLYDTEDPGTVLELRKQLRDKEMKLTDIRLEALSSAHQLEQLRETMNKMKVRHMLLVCLLVCLFVL